MVEQSILLYRRIRYHQKPDLMPSLGWCNKVSYYPGEQDITKNPNLVSSLHCGTGSSQSMEQHILSIAKTP